MKQRDTYRINFELYDTVTDQYILKLKKFRFNKFKEDFKEIELKFK